VARRAQPAQRADRDIIQSGVELNGQTVEPRPVVVQARCRLAEDSSLFSEVADIGAQPEIVDVRPNISVCQKFLSRLLLERRPSFRLMI